MSSPKRRIETLTWPQRKCDMYKRQAVIVAFILVLVAGVAASYWAARQGEQSGARAGQLAASRLVRQEAEDFTFKLAMEFRNQQVQSCERGNKIRRESNRRVDLHTKQNKATRIIASTAQKARLRGYKQNGQPFELEASEAYGSAVKLVDSIKFTKIPPVDCDVTIPMPKRPQGNEKQ